MLSLARFGVCVLLASCGAACVPLGDLAAYSQDEVSYAGAPSASTGLPSGTQMAGSELPHSELGGSELGGSELGGELQDSEATATSDPEQLSPMLGLPPAVATSENAEDAAARGDAGDAGVPAAVPPGAVTDACSGASFADLCWYLGDPGVSCNDPCRPHGGYASAATAFVGTRAQGGEPERCNAVLLALGSNRVVRSVERSDGRGVGCHFFGTEDDPWWLSAPDFNPAFSLNRARLVCGCTR